MRHLSRIVVAALLLATALPSGALARQPGNIGSTAAGRVFFPNPVAQLGDESLTDQKDADYAALQAAYVNVTLTNLDGTGYLCGDWVCIVSETGDPAFSRAGVFSYGRHDDRFEQVMAYYWITVAQNYIQSLGFGSRYPGIDNQAQRVRINQLGYDNSFATDHPKYELRFGKGGVPARSRVLSVKGSAITGQPMSRTSSLRHRIRHASPTGTRSRTPLARSTACAASTRRWCIQPTWTGESTTTARFGRTRSGTCVRHWATPTPTRRSC
jgi:hypothetical protein